MAAPASPALLAGRGVVLVEPSLLPALVPDGWREAGMAGSARVVEVGGRAEGTRPFLVAPTENLEGAVRALAGGGAAALFLVGACASPTRSLEPGDVLVVERAGDAEADPALTTKLTHRCELRGVPATRGEVGADAVAESEAAGTFLAAARDAGLPAGVLLVCQGPGGEVTAAPAAVLEAFDRVFGVLQEVLGSERKPAK